jgi:hypothetical protein
VITSDSSLCVVLFCVVTTWVANGYCSCKEFLSVLRDKACGCQSDVNDVDAQVDDGTDLLTSTMDKED